MGIESYFFTIILHGQLSETEVKSFFQGGCEVKPYSMSAGKLFKRRIIEKERFVIDNKAIVRIYTSAEGINVNFELCFSNYASNVVYIFDIAKKLCLLGDSARLILPNCNLDFSLVDLDNFKQILQKSYKDKRLSFRNKYGNINVDILPHEFYSYIRKH